MKEILESLNLQIKKLKKILPQEEFLKAQKFYFSGNCQVLTYGKDRWEVLVESLEGEDEEWLIFYDENDWYCSQKKIQKDWTPESAASLFQIREDLQKTERN